MKSPFYSLTANRPYIAIDIQFEAATLVVENKTGSAVFIRLGAQDQPTSANADLVVPAGMSQSYPVNGFTFAAAFDNPAAISTAVAAKSGLFQTCKLQLLDGTELSPSYGTASFLSLSISELQPITALPGPANSSVFDIGAWGGALVYINPTSASGQGLVTIQVSNDAVTFYTVKSFAFWPGVPAILTIPRVAKFFQLSFNILAGEPAMAGTYAVRATLQEIQTIAYNPSTNSIIKAFSMAANGSQQFTFLTVGLPAVSLAAIATVGTGASASMTFLVEATSDFTNYRQVTFRTQRMSQGITLYRALGALDIALRVTVFEVGGVSALVGSLYASIPPEADLGYILNTIQQSLGDISAPTTVPPGSNRGDIYHELEAMFQVENTNLPNLSNLAGMLTTLNAILVQDQSIQVNTFNTNTNVALLNTPLNTIATNTGNSSTTEANILSLETVQLPNIATNTGNTATSAAAIQSSGATTATNTGTTATNTGTTATNTASLPANIPGMKTDLDNMNSALSRTSTVVSTAGNVVVAANTWTNAGGLFTAGDKITFAQCGIIPTVLGSGCQLVMATGTAGVQGAIFYQSEGNSPAAGAGTPVAGIGVKYDSLRSGGWGVIAGSTNLWVFATVAGTFLPMIVTTT